MGLGVCVLAAPELVVGAVVGELVGRPRPAPAPPPPTPARMQPAERLALEVRPRRSGGGRPPPREYAPVPPDASLDGKRLPRRVVITLVVLAVLGRLVQWGQPLRKPLLDSLPVWAEDTK